MTQMPFSWMNQTAGRSGNTYQQYVNDANFDPWTNLDSYLGPGGSQSAAAQQAFGYTNQMARGMGYADGNQLPPELKRRLFLANLERTHQQFADNGQNWAGDAASRLTSTGWNYTPGWGLNHGGQSRELQSPAYPGDQKRPTDPGYVPTSPPGTPTGPNPTPGLPTKTPTTTDQTLLGAQPGQLSAAQKMALGSDPAQAYRYMLQQLGFQPDAPGMLGNFLKQKFQPLLEARMAAGGLEAGGSDASYLDTIDNLVRGFGQGMTATGNGGNFFAQQAQVADRAAQQGRGFLDTLAQQGQSIQYLNQLAMLRNAGANPLIQQAYADQAQRAQHGYEDLSFNNELQGQNIDPFTQWLMTQPGYRNIFGY